MPKTSDSAVLKPTVEEQLATIVHHIERMDRRDRLRTIGGFFRSIIMIIPVALVLASTWYIYKHGAELMQMLVKQSAEQAMKFSADSSMMEQFQKMMPQR